MSRPAPTTCCLLLALAACVATACRDREAKAPPHVAPRPVLVDTLTVQPRPALDVVRATGSVEPVRRTVLSAEVAGTVTALPIDVGQRMKAGQVVATIDDESYRIAVQRATALRDVAKADVEQARQERAREQERFDNKTLFEEALRDARFRRTVAQADRDLAVANHRDAGRKLAHTLALSRKGVASQSALDAARDAEASAAARLDAARASLEQAGERLKRQEAVFASALLSRRALDTAAARLAGAQARLHSAQADLDAALKSLRDCRIAAPFAGEIADKLVEVGHRVAPGTPVATLVDVARVKLATGLPDVDRVRIRKGAEATIAVDAYPGMVRRGKVSAVAPAASEDTGVFLVEITIDNPADDRPLIPGMIARIELLARRYGRAIVVPRHALLADGTKRYVYVVEQQAAGKGTAAEQAVARRRDVVVARTIGDHALIAGGLAAGTHVVVLGQQSLRDGAAIRLRATPAPPAQASAGLVTRAGPPSKPTSSEGTQ